MRIRTRRRWLLPSFCALLTSLPTLAVTPSAEERSLTELRNTVINLLQGLVDKGVITREQAEAMVRNAQQKAESDLAAKTEQDKQQQKAEEGAVRVPYVPPIVKDEIRKEVVAEIAPQVKEEVAKEVSSPDTLRSALPEWMRRMRWYGDIRLRGEGDNFAPDNATNTYLDFNTINSKGGIGKAGLSALLNTTEDRDRLRMRLRYGFETDLGDGWSAGARLATGTNSGVFTSTNQTFGTYGQHWQVGADLAYIRWAGQSSSGRQQLTATGGRIGNPWLSTELVWYNDLTFDGVAGNYRFNFSSDNDHRKDFFLTAGAFPLQDETPSSQDKWLAGGQLGFDFRTQGESRFRIGGAYYDYIHIVGIRNSPDSTFYDYTAPALVQKGNTLYDIRNSTTDTTVNLFALAADYRLVDVIAVADWRIYSRYLLSLTADAVKNIGFNEAQVLVRTGVDVKPRVMGYRADLAFGSSVLERRGGWKVTAGYRYIQRDAVLDAFNDEDFHLGGTDAKGYVVSFDYAFNPRVWLRARYLSATEIDGPPLGIDVWQLDLNTQF